jgi:hypothetical protein
MLASIFALVERYVIWIFLACVIGLVISSILIVKSYRDSKRAPYFFMREEATSRLRQALFIFVPLLALTVLLGLNLIRPEEPSVSLAETPTVGAPVTALPPTAEAPVTAPPPTAEAMVTTQIPTVEAAATETPTVTLTQMATPSRSPTSTPSLPKLPTSTPQATVTPTTTAGTGSPTPTRTATPTFGTPLSGARLGSITFARSMSNDKPVGAATDFPAGTGQVYAFFEYEGMRNGLPWGHAWYLNGDEILAEKLTWELGSRGTAWLFIKTQKSGNYEVRLFVEDQLEQTGTFRVR